MRTFGNEPSWSLRVLISTAVVAFEAHVKQILFQEKPSHSTAALPAHFQNTVPFSAPHRVVALLDAYVKRVPGSPHLPAMVPPLLQALERAGKPSGSQSLAERLQVGPPGLFYVCRDMFGPRQRKHEVVRAQRCVMSVEGQMVSFRVRICTSAQQLHPVAWAVMTLIRASDGARPSEDTR